jgi:hypothetical protein
VVKLLVYGTNAEPFQGRTLPPINRPLDRPLKLPLRSRERFAVSRQEAETKINRWTQGDVSSRDKLIRLG